MSYKTFGKSFGALKQPGERFSIGEDGREQYIVEYHCSWRTWRKLVPERGSPSPHYPQFFLEKIDCQRVQPESAKLTLTYSTTAKAEEIPADEINENITASTVSIKQHPKFKGQLKQYWDEKNDRFKLNSPVSGHETYYQGGVTITRREFFKSKPVSNRKIIGTRNNPPGETGKQWLCIGRTIEKSGQWLENIQTTELVSLGNYNPLTNTPPLPKYVPPRGSYYTLIGVDIQSIDLPSNICTANGHGLTTGQAVRISSTDKLPDASPVLHPTLIFYVGVVSNNQFQLFSEKEDALSNTDPVDFISAGTGTHSLISGDFEVNDFKQWKIGDLIVSNGFGWQKGNSASNPIWVRGTNWLYTPNTKGWPASIYGTTTNTQAYFFPDYVPPALPTWYVPNPPNPSNPFFDNVATGINIPDNDPEDGLIKKLQVPNLGGSQLSYVLLWVNISHRNRSQLDITLIAPSGEEEVIDGSSLVGTSNLQLRAYDCETFESVNPQGVWTLRITDNKTGQQGKLKKWRMEIGMPIE